MNRYYYQFPDMIQQHYNLPLYGFLNVENYNHVYLYRATIAWHEYDGVIKYIKHPKLDTFTYVFNDSDIKQFRWIKLQAMEL